MHYNDLREFITGLEQKGELQRIAYPLDPYLEITEVCHRVLIEGGPALLFENPTRGEIPLLANLFGHVDRIYAAMGCSSTADVRELGKLLAFLKEPDPPKNMKSAFKQLPVFKKVLDMAPKKVGSGVCQQNIIAQNDIDLSWLPVQTCWPDDAAPLMTWGLTVTKNITGTRQNLGIYRQQIIDKNRIIMRWLAHRGGALDYQMWRQKFDNKPFPVAVVIGADPATTLAAVTPIPDTLSEYAFAGLLRGSRTKTVSCKTVPLDVPSNAEIVLEGHIYADDYAEEGPFGDHTGYYNETETFPVMTIERITHRNNPIYHSTYTGRPPDEPAMLGVVLNELLIPILIKQFPEVTDFYLPPEGCSYRVAVISMKKSYPGHAKRIMMGVWSYLRQFMYTKWIIVTDDDIDVRNWQDVIWALSTRCDPVRDVMQIERTPIDYLDFASPQPGLGGKIGFDATNKLAGETSREWGRPIVHDPKIVTKIDDIWEQIFSKSNT